MVGYELKVVGNSQRAIYRVHGLLNSLKIRMEYARESPRDVGIKTKMLVHIPVGFLHIFLAILENSSLAVLPHIE